MLDESVHAMLRLLIMPAKDNIHDAIKNALVKDGWVITSDPLTVAYRDTTIFVDLGAEQVIAAERQGEQIAVEIKTFAGRSVVHDMEVALGQYMLYKSFLEEVDPRRRLYLAVSDFAYNNVFTRGSMQMVVQKYQLPIIVVDVETEEVVLWIR